jgi:hypothetical protein
MMFEKFNPAAWIEGEKSSPAKVANPANSGDDLQTLATLAALAASDRQSQNIAEAEPTIPSAIPDVAVNHLVQAVLDRWPGAVITAVRSPPDGKERTFQSGPNVWADPPLTYAEGSAASTAALPPPHEMTESWTRKMRRQDLGPCRFAWVPPLGEAGQDYALTPPAAKKSRRGGRAAADAQNAPKDDAPDLQTLVTKFGSYAGIPEKAWSEFDQAMAEWDRVRRETYEKEKTASRRAAKRQHDKGGESLR